MTKDMDPEEYVEVGEEQEPPYWLFEVALNDEPRARVFGPKDKRNWVLWRLSKYVVALSNTGVVSVRRFINGKWVAADDWRTLGN